MTGFFTRERFGRPQFVAGLFLLLFLAQCIWLTAHSNGHWEDQDVFRVDEGLRQWRGTGIAGTPLKREPSEISSAYAPLIEFDHNDGYDPSHSPLWYLIASAPLLAWPAQGQADVAPYFPWLIRLPYLSFGLLLGASLWYVARRLYGNAGGYVALALYCFSPAILRSTAVFAAEPEIGAAWGTFGAVFTAIAVAHTLYAPREVVLWNWRRILLLGLSLALAVGSQFSLIWIAPVALAFMLYVASTRKAASLMIWSAACAIALLLIFASYAFHPGALWDGLRHADFLGADIRAFGMGQTYTAVFNNLIDRSPAMVIALPISLIALGLWPRTRYFGNLAPVLVASMFLALQLGSPHYPGMGFGLMAVPFLFVFVSGIAADLLETT